MLYELAVAVGLMLVLEGILYALAPGAMRRMLAALLEQPEDRIRLTGLATAGVGLLIVMLLRG
ncbi:MAG: DUF2065 family protein [Alphaproteobacteria bacterium]|nr:DUF2065 family protein [Alphaproteobacteria bacterium]